MSFITKRNYSFMFRNETFSDEKKPKCEPERAFFPLIHAEKLAGQKNIFLSCRQSAAKTTHDSPFFRGIMRRLNGSGSQSCRFLGFIVPL
ncbi:MULTISPECIES: hypothetical protein [unclassified Citrobacter]|uniref:hypothetical protein n=1 Tax=unclassified Citrobacter TaxID=2644389 RepID=UPI00257540A2|nr:MULTISPECIES: hypothetical protein [unclassified Citrobacter]MDM2995959.1 hypothetical protein [Citrobacter sp. CK195]MDM3129861.1 hypothetical protein [Citrobacter sp. CK205]